MIKVPKYSLNIKQSLFIFYSTEKSYKTRKGQPFLFTDVNQFLNLNTLGFVYSIINIRPDMKRKAMDLNKMK